MSDKFEHRRPTKPGWYRFKGDDGWECVEVFMGGSELSFIGVDWYCAVKVSETTDDQWAGEIPMPEDGE